MITIPTSIFLKSELFYHPAVQHLWKELQTLHVKRVVVAFSGGSDSTALLAALLVLRKILRLSLFIIHVNHKRREKSDQEAQKIASLCESFNLSYEIIELESTKNNDSNVEMRLRQLRYESIEQCCHRYGFQTVLIAHHRKDLAEEISRRVAEKHPWSTFYVGSVQTTYRTLTLVRPWYYLHKEIVDDFSNQAGLISFSDPTNNDGSNLRSRIRHQFFPVMDRVFQRNSVDAWVHLNDQMKKITEYINKKTEHLEKGFLQGSHAEVGFFEERVDLLEFIIVVKKWLHERLGLPIPEREIEKLYYLRKDANKKLSWGKTFIYADRFHIIYRKKEPLHFKEIRLEEKNAWYNLSGSTFFLRQREVDKEETEVISSWKEAILCRATTTIPIFLDQNLFLSDYKSAQSRKIGNHSLRVWYQQHRVPKAIAEIFPVIVDQSGQVLGEFLSGSAYPFKKESEEVSRVRYQLEIE